MDIQNSGAAPERVDFSKIKTSIPIPNLIEVQKKSYERFLQMDLLPNEREDTGLQTEGRIIDLAQSVVEGITLLTSDPLVAQYPGPVRKV